jgi:hypothetical protein
MRTKDRNPAERLRFAVEALPRRTREAMLRGIDSNHIVVGAYVDRDSGGICPMLAAHRNGGRTNLGSFARAWDRYTGAKRPRLASRRELRTLRSLLELSLAGDDLTEVGSMAEAAAQIRSEREAQAMRERAAGARSSSDFEGAAVAAREAPCIQLPEPDDHPIRVRRLRWSWMRPARRYEEFTDLLAAAEEQLAEQRPAGDGDHVPSHLR